MAIKSYSVVDLQSGNSTPITKKGLLIGRDPSKCQIVLVAPEISEVHAWLVPMDAKIALIDRDSTNGIFVNGKRLNEKTYLEKDAKFNLAGLNNANFIIREDNH